MPRPARISVCDCLHLQWQYGPVNFTLATDLHLFLPTSLRRALADRSVDEPAQMPSVELPGGTIPRSLRGATPRQPARLALFGSVVFQSKN